MEEGDPRDQPRAQQLAGADRLARAFGRRTRCGAASCERLPKALATIEERARHLEGFIRDYARFAKLPAPRLEAVPWSRFLAQLRTQVDFVAEGLVGEHAARFDAAQLEQGLLNLLKNAHESGSAAEEVRLRPAPHRQRLAHRRARSRPAA